MRWRIGVAVAALAAVAAVAAVATSGPEPETAAAASHREAPLISLDPGADITDFFLFRSYEQGKSDRVALVMDVTSEEPSSGPNYWRFDPSVVYSFNVDNDADGDAEDVRFEFRFQDEFRGVNKDLGLFLSYVALPPITKLDGPGSEGLGLRQRYSVTMVQGKTRTQIASGLIAVPSNVGPRTMPDYDSLAAQGVYDLDGGVRVFAGQRDDPFYIDLGALFDTLNLRAPGTDMLSGFNVNTIALELPSTMLTLDQGKPVLGAYAATSRNQVQIHRGDSIQGEGKQVQVQRLANPLVNEAIIGTADKDKWNALDPDDEEAFTDYYDNLRLTTALEAVFGADASPLLNVKNLLLKYDSAERNLSELLRLDLRVAPTPLASQQRLTVLAGDNAGWPNGRRPIDDVTDIAVKVIGGTNYLTASDGVDANDKPFAAAFPFLPSPHDGRNRAHANP